jgi:hypothetical protein
MRIYFSVAFRVISSGKATPKKALLMLWETSNQSKENTA